jgi:uncharacterized protein YggT (Ycf19 family)
MLNSINSLIIGLINVAFSISEIGLLLRFIFRLFGANPNAPFVEFLYNSTSPLLYPFRNIFEPYVIEQKYVFEFSTLIAIAIYALIAWLLTELVRFIVRETKSIKRDK